MENNNSNNGKKEFKIELSPEVAAGHYSNFAVITHSPNEFFLDFVTMSPNTPARVQSRIIMTPENAKTLLYALRENVQNYEKNFGEIQRKGAPQNAQNNGNIPNPFAN